MYGFRGHINNHLYGRRLYYGYRGCLINLLVEHDVVSWTDLEERVNFKKIKLKQWSDIV